MINTNGLTDEQFAVVIGMMMDDGTASEAQISWMTAYTEATLQGSTVDAKTDDVKAEGWLSNTWGWSWLKAKAVWKAIKSFFMYIGRACKEGWKRSFASVKGLFSKKLFEVDGNNVKV